MYIIIIGCGGAGEALVRHLIAEGHETVVVEVDGGRAKRLAESLDALIINGDGSDIDILKDAGIENADAAAIMTNDDNINLTVCQLAKKFNVGRIVARVNEPEKKELYINLGISAAISPESAAVSYFKNALTQEMKKSIISIAKGQAEIMELQMTNGSLDGKKIRDVDMPTGSTIAVIYRNGEVMIGDENEVLKVGDTLTVITKADVSKDVSVILTGA